MACADQARSGDVARRSHYACAGKLAARLNLVRPLGMQAEHGVPATRVRRKLRPGMLTRHSSAEAPDSDAVAVFVHGIFGGSESWGRLLEFVRDDAIVRREFHLVYFSYATPPFSFNPLRRIPDLGDVADSLATALDSDPVLRACSRIVLLGHSQGGLVIQQYLAKALAAGRGARLQRIRAVLMFATPTTGSQLFLTARRGLGRLGIWNHPQEATLRPYNDRIEAMRRSVLQQIVYAAQVGPASCPIPFHVFAGASDGVVTRESARWVFPTADTLPGDHSSLIRPAAAGDLVCNVVIRALRRALQVLDSDGIAISTQAADAENQADIDAIVELQSENFLPNARVRPKELTSWLREYRTRFGIDLSVIVARAGNEIVGFVMFHEAPELIVVDYIAIGAEGRRPAGPARELVSAMLIERIRQRAMRLDCPVVFEIEDPRAITDRSERRRAEARIRLFVRSGARLVQGFPFPAPDMEVPLAETESAYLLMLARAGRMEARISRERLASIVEFLYLTWYRNWFVDAHDKNELESYLTRLNARVQATIPNEAALVEDLRQ